MYVQRARDRPTYRRKEHKARGERHRGLLIKRDEEGMRKGEIARVSERVRDTMLESTHILESIHIVYHWYSHLHLEALGATIDPLYLVSCTLVIAITKKSVLWEVSL